MNTLDLSEGGLFVFKFGCPKSNLTSTKFPNSAPMRRVLVAPSNLMVVRAKPKLCAIPIMMR